MRWFLSNIALIYILLTNQVKQTPLVKKIIMGYINSILGLVIIFSLFSCKTIDTDINRNYQVSGDNKYDSEFPYKSISKELENISKTVKKLDVLAFYSNYYFPDDSNISKKMLNDSILKTYWENRTITHESVSGTASVIYRNNGIIGLLTCAHVIDFKDTIFSYQNTDNGRLTSVSIKIKQQNNVASLIVGEPIEIIAIDKKMDIALLMKKAIPFDQVHSVLNYPIGNINDLQWGSLVYIMGYPHGNLMVTRAIASLTKKMKTGFFVTDALYNHGISGSPVFAIRDGSPNFELVGMASSAAAQESNILVANDDYKEISKQKVPYTGDIFVDNNKLISYGVTYSVSINKIINFIHQNDEVLLQNGFETNNFFK